MPTHFRKTATFRRGEEAIAAAEDPAALAAQVRAAWTGGPTPMPAWHAMFDPAARPAHHYRPVFLCLCGFATSSEGDAFAHVGLWRKAGVRAKAGCDIKMLPPAGGA